MFRISRERRTAKILYELDVSVIRFHKTRKERENERVVENGVVPCALFEVRANREGVLVGDET